MDLIKVRVARKKQEAIDICSFELVPAGGGTLPHFTAGSHIDVHTPGGPVRQYSLCQDPEDNAYYRIAVKREPASRGGSAAMHDALAQGDTLTIAGPRNNFPLDETAEKSVLFAGGIGITPLLAMALRLDRLGKPFELQYFSRGPSFTAFHDVLSQKKFAASVGFHYALEPEAVRAYVRKYLWHRHPGAHLYVCGPRAFMDLVEQTAAVTWPPESVHLEYFTADSNALSGPRDTFIVKLARSGGEYSVTGDKTITQALAEHGIHIETSCEQGVCGTCLTGVLGGIPDHRDVFLTDEEREANDRMTPCVSRSCSAVIVLDL
jgi:vanillate O-demethylase ferredoxin subunit